MTVKLVLNRETVGYLSSNLGEGRVTILEDHGDGYVYVSFEVKTSMDVLSILHAGQDRGVNMAFKREAEAA